MAREWCHSMRRLLTLAVGVWLAMGVEAQAPWTKNVSRPNNVKSGLADRHIALWQSHGRYYDQGKGYWKWQRPNLFCTTEDLFTQTIVVPYLIPMLENAGAVVFTPRERDLQRQEIIVDNDFCYPGGKLEGNNIQTNTVTGFRYHTGNYRDGENPFRAGTALTLATTAVGTTSSLIYVPEIKEAGRYAVYVSYPHLDDAVDDVHYTVCHKGVRTEFVVNQQIGFGTWVYLGTFDFGLTSAEDHSGDNCIELSTASKQKGHIGADAVRLGGGMGNVARAGEKSGLPRCLEGARYACQWAGAPYEVYSPKDGENDYTDDINCRSLMVNWLSGGSTMNPQEEGLGIPFELSLAVHSDAGYQEDGESIYGSMAIATTSNGGSTRLPSGLSRQTSLTFAGQLLDNLNSDMLRTFHRWDKRFLRDRNYSETRLPNVPSAIIETMSHQNFPDMKIGEHPYGKFMVARSLYKTILRYVASRHKTKYVVQPLPPHAFSVTLDGAKATLRWAATNDPLEKTATPTSYNVYTATEGKDFDNGMNVGTNSVVVTLKEGVQYDFRVTACNDGGESFPTETLSAFVTTDAKGVILVVNGFERLSAPYVVDNYEEQGFDLTRDEGVQMGLYHGWSGHQTSFDKRRMGSESFGGLGYCGDEMVGHFVMGNEFNYVCVHCTDIAEGKKYSVASCSLDAFKNGDVGNLSQYAMLDLVFGLQKDDEQLGLHFKTFSPEVKKQLETYAKKGGAILVSGSFLGSDMRSADEMKWLGDMLHLRYRVKDDQKVSETVKGLGTSFSFFHELTSEHYAATHPEILSPVDDKAAICVMQYSDGTSAAVAYKGKCSTFAMGFPFECIKESKTRGKLMQAIISYLLK